MNTMVRELVHVPSGQVQLEGMLVVPADARGVVLFAHGSGSSRHSPRNNFVAMELQRASLATLLIDLLTVEEDATYDIRFDITLLSVRLGDVAHWLGRHDETARLPLGLFGASTGAAAALNLAAALPERVAAVVSRGGRPDLAESAALARVRAPTLLIVGGNDAEVIELNRTALNRLHCIRKMHIVPSAGHLFSEPGTLEEVARLGTDWFTSHLTPAAKL
jgi:putative phosphoribosyl transferase